jgi:choline dehydrogenase
VLRIAAPHIRRGRRQSAATAFLDPARTRAHLDVRTGVHVERVVFDAQRRALAVQTRCGGRPERFEARSEIILCAGALLSPHILQLSGIGPAAMLHAAGVEPLVDRRDVGRRMLEHLGFTLAYRLRGADGINKEFYRAGLLKNVLRYFLLHNGPLATGPFEVGAFVRCMPQATRPDAQLYGGAFTFARGDDNFPVPLADVEREPGLTLYGQLLRLTSEGEIAIRSPNPDAPLHEPAGHCSVARAAAVSGRGVSER